MTGSTFRLFDVLTLIAIALLLLGATIAARQLAQSKQDITHCADNLRKLYVAHGAYVTAHGEPPRTRYEPDKPITAFTGSASTNPFAADGPQANDVTAAIFMLARESGISADVFNCPAALRNGLAEQDTFDATTVRQRSNFRARVNYNYSFQNMYLPADSAGPSDVMAADTNPGGQGILTASTQETLQQVRLSNSPNHQRDGQNVLFRNGEVRFEPSAFFGKPVDNIYAPGGVQLVPEWSAGPDVTPKAVSLRRWAFSIAMVATTLLLIFIVFRGRRKSAGLRV